MAGVLVSVAFLLFVAFVVLWSAGMFHLPRRYPEWRSSHQIIKQKSKTGPMSRIVPHRFVCQICLQSWLSADSVSDRCPGLPTYSQSIDDDKPAYLVTARELKVLGYQSPSGPPLAYLLDEYVGGKTAYIPLYDERTAEREVTALPKP